MANMQMTKTPMPEQDPQVRNHNFLEVAQGYTLEQAMNEAQRCIHCKNPACVSGCPVGIPIPDFLAKVAEGDIAAAYEILSNANALPAISGRVCPQENQCEGKCVRGVKGEPVAIGRVERFVADWAAEQGIANVATAPKNGHKVAVIGSGPAGLTCAGELARMGYDVTVFEAFHTAGGVLVYGIPEFRLPKAIVQNEVDKLTALGAGTATLSATVAGQTVTCSVTVTQAPCQHQWDDGVVTTEPTCTQDGVRTYTCQLCGATRTEAIPATGHTVVIDPAVAPTCTHTGLTEGSHCSVCNTVIVAQTELHQLAERTGRYNAL